MAAMTMDESRERGYVDAYEERGYALDHGGPNPTLSELERAYIAGFKEGEEALMRDTGVVCDLCRDAGCGACT